MDLSSLSSGLPASTKINRKDLSKLDISIASEFKDAAKSVASLYRLSSSKTELIKNLGYLECIDDLINLLKIGGNPIELAINIKKDLDDDYKVDDYEKDIDFFKKLTTTTDKEKEKEQQQQQQQQQEEEDIIIPAETPNNDDNNKENKDEEISNINIKSSIPSCESDDSNSFSSSHLFQVPRLSTFRFKSPTNLNGLSSPFHNHNNNHNINSSINVFKQNNNKRIARQRLPSVNNTNNTPNNNMNNNMSNNNNINNNNDFKFNADNMANTISLLTNDSHFYNPQNTIEETIPIYHNRNTDNIDNNTRERDREREREREESIVSYKRRLNNTDINKRHRFK